MRNIAIRDTQSLLTDQFDLDNLRRSGLLLLLPLRPQAIVVQGDGGRCRAEVAFVYVMRWRRLLLLARQSEKVLFVCHLCTQM